MQAVKTDQMTFTDTRHMPIVKDYARQIGLVETIDQLVDTQMELSPGMAVLAMVLDTLLGRTPLYRLTEFFEEKDTELLLGAPSKPTGFATPTWADQWTKSLTPAPRRSSPIWPKTP